MFKLLAKIFGIVSGALGLVLLLVYAFTMFNSYFHWITSGDLYNAIQFLRSYGILALIVLSSGSLMLGRLIIFKIIWILLLILIIVLMIIFPMPIL